MFRNERLYIGSWCLFDFANSSYSAVIAAVVFPVYYVSVIVGNRAGEGDLWWGRAISASMAFVALSSPLLGGIADYSGTRKRLLACYTLLCVSCVASFSFLRSGMAVEGFLLVVGANIGMEGGIVFYNSYLPEIAGRDIQGRVSAWGYAVGYAGSICALLMVLPMVNAGNFGMAWLSVAAFFLLFSLPALVFLPGDRHRGMGIRESALSGARYTMQTVRKIIRERDARTFLAAYLLYEDGVGTVIVFSGIFAATTLHFTGRELVMLYLLVQVTALTGAFGMARPIDRWGPARVINISLILWTCVSAAAFLIDGKHSFLALAAVAGLGLGTIQAASRALFARYIPSGRESEYFGVYSLVGKSSAIAGPMLFGYVSSVMGSQRPAILAISIFFAAGLVLMQYVRGGGPAAPKPPRSR